MVGQAALQVQLLAAALLSLARLPTSRGYNLYYAVPYTAASLLQPGLHALQYPALQYPALQTPPLQRVRVVCSVCDCHNDYWCAWNCPACRTPQFCSTCPCSASFGCARNCNKCAPGAERAESSTECWASGGPSSGNKCVFPFIYQA